MSWSSLIKVQGAQPKTITGTPTIDLKNLRKIV